MRYWMPSRSAIWAGRPAMRSTTALTASRSEVRAESQVPESVLAQRPSQTAFASAAASAAFPRALSVLARSRTSLSAASRACDWVASAARRESAA